MKHYHQPDGVIRAFELDGSQDHLITSDMVPYVLPDVAPYVPTKDDLIADTLRTVGKGNSRALVQTIILLSESVLIPKLAEDYGVSLELAKMGAYARNPMYRSAVDCEAACRAIETTV